MASNAYERNDCARSFAADAGWRLRGSIPIRVIRVIRGSSPIDDLWSGLEWHLPAFNFPANSGLLAVYRGGTIAIEQPWLAVYRPLQGDEQTVATENADSRF